MTKPVSDLDVIRLYRSLKRIRRVEEVIADIYPSDKIKSPVHLAIGQEHVSVGVCDVLDAGDFAGGTYRSHAAYLAKGADLKSMLAEMFGKDTGCARGKGGSMHIINAEANVLGSSAVVGTVIPNAAGHALAIKMRHENRVVAVFFGDGATEEGCFYETLNFASLHKLPILFVCENNGYAIHQPISKRWASEALCERVTTFNMRAHRHADSDIFAIRNTAQEAIARIRSGGGPEFMECKVYRWREHVGPNEDYDQGYRTRAEGARWIEDDQVARLARMLPGKLQAHLDAEIEEEIAEALAFAEASAPPDADELTTCVYA